LLIGSTWRQGDNTTTTRTTYAMVRIIFNAVDIVTGFGSACALLQTGSVACWGYARKRFFYLIAMHAAYRVIATVFCPSL
jgi:hypothetical protein